MFKCSDIDRVNKPEPANIQFVTSAKIYVTKDKS